MPDQSSESRGSASTRSDALREEQAIAAAMMIGEEMRRSDRMQTYTITLRLSLFVAGMTFIGLIILFGYARIAKDGFNPYPYMIALGLAASGSAVAAYWAYVESRRANRD